MYKNSHIYEYANSNLAQLVKKLISAKYFHVKFNTFTVICALIPVAVRPCQGDHPCGHQLCGGR